MSSRTDWREVWENKSAQGISDFELDRGHPPDQEGENLSEEELINFVEPREFETVLDAGCGTGVNVARFHSRVKHIIGIDYSEGSLERCKKRIEAQKVENAQLSAASVTRIPLPDGAVDKVLCLSVLQYLDDQEARNALREFVRVVAPGGVIILHVKNLSSIYWSTLWAAKTLKSFLGGRTRIEHFRTFHWYVNELTLLKCEILDYYSSNLFIVDVMSPSLISFVRGFELRHHGDALFRSPLLRRHGAELLLKVRIPGRHLESPCHNGR